MTVTRITVVTYNGVYTEDCYGLAETIERIETIQRCANVIGVEVMSMETGEILYHDLPTEGVYVAPTFVVDLVEEVLG